MTTSSKATASRWVATLASGCALGGCATVRSTVSRAAELSPAAMHADLAYLREHLLDQHPHPFLYTGQKEFERLYHVVDGEVDKPLDKIAFYRSAARLAASLQDGHTLVEPLLDDFHAYAKIGGVFPLEVAFIDGRLYVHANHSGDAALAPGVELVAIDGKDIATIVSGFRELINEVHPIYDVYARLFREMMWLRYGASHKFIVGYRNGTAPTRRVAVAAHVFAEDAFNSYGAADTSYDFTMTQQRDVGVLTINSFSPSEGFAPFLEKTFTTLDEKKTAALVIDIRKNGGGSGRLAQDLMSYLTDQPYRQIGAFYVKVTAFLKALYERGTTHTDEDTKRIVMNNPDGALVDGLKDSGPLMATPPHRDHVYRGPVYLLTANNTFSAAAMFTAYAKCSGRAIVVGEEPGQTTNFVADAVPFTMPASKLEFGVSFSEIHMPCEQSYQHGIRPDHPMSATPTSLAAGQDPVMDLAFKLITERRQAVR